MANKDSYRFIDFQNKGEEVELLLYDVIGEGFFGGTSAKSVAEKLSAAKDAKTITVRINSPGGNVFEGFAIYNALRQHSARVVVNVDGFAASIASVIAMAGDEVNVAGNAMFMIHNPSAGVWGESDEMRKTADLLDQIKGGIIKAYETRADDQVIDLAADMDAETWYTAEDAVIAGLADNVYEPVKAAAMASYTNEQLQALHIDAPANVVDAMNVETPENGVNMPNEENQEVEAPEVEASADDVADVEAAAEVEVIDQVEEPVEEQEAPADPRAEAKRFIDAFGDQGGVYYAEGLSFEEAAAQHCKALQEENAKLRGEVTDLKERVTNETGEDDAVSFTNQDKPKQAAKGLVGAMSRVIKMN